MTIPFPQAAAAEPTFTYDYAGHLARITGAIPGYEKARLFLELMNQIEKDKIGFNDISTHTKDFPNIRQALVSNNLLATICQDTDGTNFCPNDDASAIHIADSIQSAQTAWHQLITSVTLNIVQRATEGAGITPRVPSAPA